MDRPRPTFDPTTSLAALLLAPLLVILAACPTPSEGRARITTLVRMESLGNCPDFPGLPNGFTSSEIYIMGKALLGRGDYRFNHTYSKVTQTVAYIRRCPELNDPHCEMFQTWRWGEESCAILTMKNMIWSPLFLTDPPVGCPLKKGTYRIENATLDISKLQLISFPEKGHFKVSVLMEADKIPKVACYGFEFTFAKLRA